MRDVSVASLSLFCPAGIGPDGATGGRKGEVPGFSAKAYVRQRKNLKLMSRAVQLGVSAIRVALADAGEWQATPPIRRGMYVGSTPQGGELADLMAALDVSTDADGGFEIGRFAQDGYPLIHPLWLVKGLSNNVLGFASASHDFQGPNGNWCDGERSGAHALYEGWVAVAEGRADIVVAGASDSWVGLEGVLGGRRPGEGAAFFVMRSASPEDPWRVRLGEGEDPDLEEAQLGYLGAAGVPVALARRLLRGEGAAMRGPGREALRFEAA